MKNEIVILGYARTPMGAYGGELSALTALNLGETAIKAAIEQSKVDPAAIEAIAFGNVISANLGQNPARQVALNAGLDQGICATNINKVCASGMKAASVLANDIALGHVNVGIAGGMESMSNAPHYLPKARFGMGYGHQQVIDGLSKDGLTDAFNQTAMGLSGDKTAAKYGISRAEQDEYAKRSYSLAADAFKNGNFESEICPVSIPQRKGDPFLINQDESFKKANFEKMVGLKPTFSPDGTVTAANASPMSDGASALILSSNDYAKEHTLAPIAQIIDYAEAETDPMFFTTAPVLAVQKLLSKNNLTVDDIDYFEVNEAFAVVPLVFMKELNVPIEKLNIWGGAVALGHPLGSSGSRIMCTLMSVLKSKNAKIGIAAICNGGGGASAILVEMC